MLSARIILSKFSRVNYKNTIRYHRRFTKSTHAQKDAGIAFRKRLAENEEDLQELEDHEFDLEADFMNVGQSHNEHIRELQHRQKRIGYLAEKQKHFKEHFPNFLTWSDKEQIRHLHQSDPQEWSIDKLSDGFPALPNVIEKIATSKWTKNSESKIHSHDEAVKQNWKSFKDNKFPEFPIDLTTHLKKFVKRDLNLQPFKTPDKIEKSMLAPNIKIGNEFSNIIRSYEKLKNKTKKPDDLLIQKQQNIAKPPEEDTFMKNTNVYSKHVTLDELREKVERKSRHKEISQDDQLILNAFQRPDDRVSAPSNDTPKDVQLIEKNNKKSDIVTIVKDKKDYSHLAYPEQITIPKTLFKRGFTYKLNDCYYDDDGEFLYRVPGMDK